jgi:vitamin B12/bleomycin/antimicrobial peptide transport system ATP-binding/permease protein
VEADVPQFRRLLAALADVRRIASPYFYGEDRRAGRLLLLSVIGLELSIVALNVMFNAWNARFYNAIEVKDWESFKFELLLFCGLAALFIAAAVYQLYLQLWLRIRWRQWMTDRYLVRWLRDGTHYRMRLTGDVADNPDQRIAEDLELFAERAVAIGIGFLGAIATLVSFVTILWRLSDEAATPYLSSVPGYLVWIALLYAIGGTLITHLIGHPLVRLNFNQQRYEADFRYHLVRIRENGEQVALLAGENAERARLGDRFARLVANWRLIMTARKRLTWFTAGYDQVSIVFPYVVVSPAFFAGTIPLGVLTQTASAFGQVQTAFSFFVNAYSQLAEWRAVTERLIGFEDSMQQAERLKASSQIVLSEDSKAALSIADLRLRLPSGVPIVSADDVVIAPEESVLVTGRSGSGKSTLFRAIAGIWPFGSGKIALGKGQTLMVLPQRPYLPFGRLDEALAYPNAPTRFTATQLAEVLNAVRLEKLVPRLDEQASWPHVLSQGEQQRISLARAILSKPDVLLLDESTSALDEDAEADLYRLLESRLPGATLISIGHRKTLHALHKRRLDLEPVGDAYQLRAAEIGTD